MEDSFLVKVTPPQFAFVQNKAFSYTFNTCEKVVDVDGELVGFLFQAFFRVQCKKWQFTEKEEKNIK